MGMSNKDPFSENIFEYFIGYKDAENIRSLSIFLPKKSAIEEISVKLNVCVFDKTKKRLEKYYKI